MAINLLKDTEIDRVIGGVGVAVKAPAFFIIEKRPLGYGRAINQNTFSGLLYRYTNFSGYASGCNLETVTRH